jgi:hypothetical protein
MNADYSWIRFPDEKKATFDDRVPFEEILEVVNAGKGTKLERDIVQEWERRQKKQLSLARKTA